MENLTREQRIAAMRQLNPNITEAQINTILSSFPSSPKDSHTAAVKAEIQNDPRFASLISTPGSLDAIINAYDTGDWSAVPSATGMPFSPEEANKAFNESMSVLDPAYAQERLKDTLNLQDTLAQKKADYENYLNTSAGNFQEEKDVQDKTAADNGVLFSTGRVQKLNSLGSRYAADAAAKRGAIATDIGIQSRNYQYKYGNEAANSPTLSAYYSLGGNTYNPNVATGGVGSSGLSSIYSPSSADFYGTNRAKQSAEAKQRAAGLLYSKGNKLVSQNYKNQY